MEWLQEGARTITMTRKCKCGHSRADHEKYGFCRNQGCDCTEYFENDN